jgi:hypothetical protein
MDAGIGGAMNCMHADALRLQPGTPGEGQPQSVTVAPGASVDVQFTCPDKRDHEEGGHYSVYTGAFYSGDQAEGVTCE